MWWKVVGWVGAVAVTAINISAAVIAASNAFESYGFRERAYHHKCAAEDYAESAKSYAESARTQAEAVKAAAAKSAKEAEEAESAADQVKEAQDSVRRLLKELGHCLEKIN